MILEHHLISVENYFLGKDNYMSGYHVLKIFNFLNAITGYDDEFEGMDHHEKMNKICRRYYNFYVIENDGFHI